MPRARASAERREKDKEKRRRARQAPYLVVPTTERYVRNAVLTGPLTKARRYGVQNQPSLFDRRLEGVTEKEFNIASLVRLSGDTEGEAVETAPVEEEAVQSVQPEATQQTADSESEDDTLLITGPEFEDLQEVSTDVIPISSDFERMSCYLS